MENNNLATFKPILLSTNNNRENIKQYYQDNNLLPDNPFMKKYLDNTITSSPAIEPQQNINIGNLLQNQFANTPYLTSEQALNEMNYNLPKPVGSVADRAKRAIVYFTGKGYTKEQASGIVGNLYTESGLNPNRPQNNGGPGYGYAQWEGPRQAQFKQIIGKNIKDSTEVDQLNFLNWELNNTEKSAGAALKQAKTASKAAEIFAKKFERMKTYNKEREVYATHFYKTS